MKGTVKFYNSEKGFGFLIHDGKDIFFHISGVTNPLYTPKSDDVVSFTTKEGKKGLLAVDINLAE